MAEDVFVALVADDLKVAEAEESINVVCDVMLVLQMAVSCESGAMDAEQRSGIETVLGYAAERAAVAREKISAVSPRTGVLRK